MIKINKILTSVGVMSILILTMFISIPQASAYTSNITVNENLTLGSTGENVIVLQGLMSEFGYLNVPINIPFGYYGTMTKDAVARYQAAQGVTPAVGYFGPITKIAMHKHFAAHNWLTLLGW